MDTGSLLSFIIAGQLRRNYILPPGQKPCLDVPGGSLLYTAAGLGVWDKGIGLIGRVGEDYPQEWVEQLSRRGFDRRGIHVLPESLDLRYFAAYPDPVTRLNDNPVAQFASRGLPFPKALLDYTPTPQPLDSRIHMTSISIRVSDIPADYLDATAAHICPIDFLTHSLLPPTFRQGHIQTITLDPSPGYMNPVFWDDIPAIVTGLTAFLTSEEKLRNLFQGRSEDLWEMAETIAGYGCEIVVIKRGQAGQLLYSHADRSRWNVPAYPGTIADPTGAGDAFCGGFLAGYRRKYDPLQAVLYGNISASLVMEGGEAFFALDALPGLAEARLQALQSMVRKV
jgi:sugar/nucleoside kinase (ribokinase family)